MAFREASVCEVAIVLMGKSVTGEGFVQGADLAGWMYQGLRILEADFGFCTGQSVLKVPCGYLYAPFSGQSLGLLF